MPSLKAGHFDKVVCEVSQLLIAAWVLVAIAICLAGAAIKLRDGVFAVASLLSLILAATIFFGVSIVARDSKAADRAAAEAKLENDKARLYFVTHYPDFEVLYFDTYQGLVRYERQDPPQVCEARLIPYGGVFLPGSAEDCAELPQGG